MLSAHVCTGFFEGELVSLPLFGPWGFSHGKMGTHIPECRCWDGSGSQPVALPSPCCPPERQQGTIGTPENTACLYRVCRSDISLLITRVRKIPLGPDSLTKW